MKPSETSELKAVRPKSTATLSGSTTTPPPPNSENLPCPRCDSTSTKFCYYNNYNLAQPRHFCKSCRRYWTQGGTLRNIPIGGGGNKNSKRSRTTITNKNTHASSSCCSASNAAAAATTTARTLTDDMHVVFNDNNVRVSESFMSLLSHGGGFEDMGSFGFGKVSTWQMNGGGGVEGGSLLDCFAWPELVIPTTGNVLK